MAGLREEFDEPLVRLREDVIWAGARSVGCWPLITLLVHALVELEIRRTMAAALKKIPLYPESRACTSPSAVRIFEVFGGLARHHLINTDGRVVQTFPPELTKLQAILLDLLGVPEDRYR